MLQWSRYLMLVVAAVATFVMLSPDAEARRLGGGRSFGKPSGSLFKRAPAAAPKRDAAAGAGQQAASRSGRSGAMGIIGGLAAGLGLAWLANSLGFGEELANLMMILLLVGGAIFLFRLLAGRRATGAPGGLRPATAGQTGQPGGQAQAGPMGMAREMGVNSPGGGSAAPVSQVAAGSGSHEAVAAGPIPADFDTDGFLHQAKVQFVRLQAVYDAADLEDLASFTTPEVFAELKLEINQRAGARNQTDVVTLEAELLGVDAEGSDYYASVHFSGMIREDPEAAAQPFSEIWLLSKPKSGASGWVLAGIEQSDA